MADHSAGDAELEGARRRSRQAEANHRAALAGGTPGQAAKAALDDRAASREHYELLARREAARRPPELHAETPVVDDRPRVRKYADGGPQPAWQNTPPPSPRKTTLAGAGARPKTALAGGPARTRLANTPAKEIPVAQPAGPDWWNDPVPQQQARRQHPRAVPMSPLEQEEYRASLRPPTLGEDAAALGGAAVRGINAAGDWLKDRWNNWGDWTEDTLYWAGRGAKRRLGALRRSVLGFAEGDETPVEDDLSAAGQGDAGDIDLGPPPENGKVPVGWLPGATRDTRRALRGSMRPGDYRRGVRDGRFAEGDDAETPVEDDRPEGGAGAGGGPPLWRRLLGGAAYWLGPDFHHPVRRALRRSGIERTPKDRPARWAEPDGPPVRKHSGERNSARRETERLAKAYQAEHDREQARARQGRAGEDRPQPQPQPQPDPWDAPTAASQNKGPWEQARPDHRDVALPDEVLDVHIGSLRRGPDSRRSDEDYAAGSAQLADWWEEQGFGPELERLAPQHWHGGSQTPLTPERMPVARARAGRRMASDSVGRQYRRLGRELLGAEFSDWEAEVEAWAAAGEDPATRPMIALDPADPSERRLARLIEYHLGEGLVAWLGEDG